MRTEGAVQVKSFRFAVRIVNACKYLKRCHHEYTLSDQLIRSGTSIGANICEAEHGHSDKDFAAKMYISYKECAETIFWLKLLHETQYFTDSQYQSLLSDCMELYRLLAAITKTAREGTQSGTSKKHVSPHNS